MRMKILCFALLISAFNISVNAQELNSATSTIKFEEMEFNFGEVVQGEIIQNVYEFTNTGTVPLVITNAKASCGCTVPRWPREPIMPGESSNLLVQFDSKGKKKYQSKRITITANTDPVNTYLTLKGKILIPELDIAEQEKPIRAENVDHASIKLYPNPSIDRLNIELPEHNGKQADIEIYDLRGQRLHKESIVIEDNYSIELEELPTATYTLSIKLEGMNRIVKQFQVNN